MSGSGSPKSSRKEFLLRVLWYGGSTFDALLNISSAKMSSRILTMPQSTAQMGLASAIPYQVFQLGVGVWVQCILSALYLKNNNACVSNRNFTTSTQLHEVIGGLLGPRWKGVSFVFNTAALFYVSSLHFLNSSTIVYLLNDTLDKRTWTFVFAAIFFLSIFIPNAHNYRVWSFIGVITTVFVSGYLTGAAITHEKLPRVRRTSPHSYEEYFRGVSGFTVLGHVVIPIEIMDAMWKPEQYSEAYAYSQVYTFLVTMVPSLMMNLRFGDILVLQPNALTLFPESKFRDATIILLLVHLFINFGMYSLAVYSISEKLLRVHDSPNSGYLKKILSRIPVFIAFWITALAFPFFGIVNKVFDTTLVIWNFYVIPCAAYNLVFWSKETRKRSKPCSTFGWVTDFSLNIGVILWAVIVEGGLALWANAASIQKTKLQLFAKCYNC